MSENRFALFGRCVRTGLGAAQSGGHQTIAILPVRTQADADAVRALLPGFVDWRLVRYADHADTIRDYFHRQDLNRQRRDLLTLFAPFQADCLLGRLDGVPAGMVMVKPHQGTTCEMNRMFVTEAARGQGVAQALVAEILRTARALCYTRMQLAAGVRHLSAVRLYRRTGFVEDPDIADTGRAIWNCG